MAISPAAGTRLSASGLSTQARYWRNKSTRKKIAPNRCRRVLDGLSRKNGLPLGGSIAPNQGPFCRLRSVFLLNRGLEFLTDQVGSCESSRCSIEPLSLVCSRARWAELLQLR